MQQVALDCIIHKHAAANSGNQLRAHWAEGKVEDTCLGTTLALRDRVGPGDRGTCACSWRLDGGGTTELFGYYA